LPDGMPVLAAPGDRGHDPRGCPLEVRYGQVDCRTSRMGADAVKVPPALMVSHV